MALLNLINPKSVEGMATTSDVGQTEEFVPASTWEVTKAQFAQFRTNSVSTATGDALYKGYQDRNKAYLDATGSEFPEFEVDNKRVYDFEDTEEYRDAEYVYKQRLKQVRLEDEFILEQRAKDPEKFKGVKTTGEMYDEIREQANMDNAEYANTMLRASGFAQTAGSFIGSAAGAMTDPINIATLPFGAARGAGILKTAFTEAGIAAGTEALIQPGVADWQRQLGNEYGLREMLYNTAGAAAGGFVIGGGTKAVANAISNSKWYTKPKTDESIALHEIQKNEMVVGTNPLEDVADQSKHYQSIRQSSDDLLNGRKIGSSGLEVKNREFNLSNQDFRLDRNLDELGLKSDLPKFQNKVFYDIGDLNFRNNLNLTKKASQDFVNYIKETGASKAALIPTGVKFKTRQEAVNAINKAANEEKALFPNVKHKIQKQNMVINKEEDGYALYRADNDISLKKDIDGKIMKFDTLENANKQLDNGEYVVHTRNAVTNKDDDKLSYMIVQGDMSGSAIMPSKFAKTKFYDEFTNIDPKLEYIDTNIKANAEDMPDEIDLFEEPLANEVLAERYANIADTRSLDEFKQDLDSLLEDNPKTMIELDDGKQISLKQAIKEIDDEADIINMMKVCSI